MSQRPPFGVAARDSWLDGSSDADHGPPPFSLGGGEPREIEPRGHGQPTIAAPVPAHALRSGFHPLATRQSAYRTPHDVVDRERHWSAPREREPDLRSRMRRIRPHPLEPVLYLAE